MHHFCDLDVLWAGFGEEGPAVRASSSALLLVLVCIFILYMINSRLGMFMYFLFRWFYRLSKSYSHPVRQQMGPAYFGDEEIEVQKRFWVTCLGPHNQKICECLARCHAQVLTEHSSMLGYVQVLGSSVQPSGRWMVKVWGLRF